MGRAFLSFTDPNISAKAYEALNECYYGSCILDIKWAEARKPDDRRDNRDDRRDRKPN